MADPKLADAYGDLYEELLNVKAENIIPVKRYRSKRTGLTICLAEVGGPAVDGYFFLVTEPKDDDGLPHTLEHLVFLGSELYPYKGVLDLVANRCFASGTNAWTAEDHTCYTVTTAGAEGFLQLLPIYLDHILYPLLADAGFITEVHHVNGDGEDAGVVYCEMQGVENTGERRTQQAVQHVMFPEPSGYHYSSGGIMKNLRESCSNEKVKKFHEKFYRPDNLCLIVVGQVNLEKLFETVRAYEDRILTKPVSQEHYKPWQQPIAPLTEGLDIVVPYPCDEEKNGLVVSAWRGPTLRSMWPEISSIQCLMEYLTDSAISPLQKEFVEIEDPYCSGVSYSLEESQETCMYFLFDNVPKNKLKEVKSKLRSLLSSLADGSLPIDLKRMKTIVRRKMLSMLSDLETNPHELIAGHLITDQIFGSGTKDIEDRFNQSSILRDLTKKPVEFWTEKLKKYLVDNKLVMAQGDPSKKLLEEMTSQGKERIKQQRERLGEQGLKEKAEQLEKAIEYNERPPPDDMINSVPVPNISDISFHSLKRSTNHHPEKSDANPKFPLSNLSVCFILDDLPSNFVQLITLFNTSALSQDLRLYLPLVAEVIMESPMLRNGEMVSHEEVIAQLTEDTVYTYAGLGVSGGSFSKCGYFAQMFQLSLRVEMERYPRAVEWLHELLYSTKFTVERLKIVTTKMINSVAELKRQGYSIAHSVLKDMSYCSESNHHANNMMRQHTFLSLVLLRLDSNPNEVLEDLSKLRKTVFSSENMTVYMAADVQRLAEKTNVLEPWKKFSGPKTAHKYCISGVKKCHTLGLPLEKSAVTSAIVGVGAVESAFLVQSVPSINRHDHPDLPAVLVMTQYLTQLEGPMWRQIRGLGLAYNYNIVVEPEQGVMKLVLYRCSHVVSAYKEAKKILERHLNGEDKWETDLLDSACSSLIFEIVNREKGLYGACEESLLSYFREIEPDFKRKLLQKVSEVTIEDVKRVAPKYLAPLISDKTRCAVCCHPSKVDDVVLGFKNLSRNLTVLPSLEDSFLAQMTK